ncbi:MAG: hypothetical protein Q9165_005304 [Trypethelium subeluteriae]
MDTQSTKDEDPAPTVLSLHSHVNKPSLTQPKSPPEGEIALEDQRMNENAAKELPQSRNTDLAAPASPKTQLPSTRSPQISRVPSQGVTIQKGPQRSQSSMSNHALSSPGFGRRVSSSSLQGSGDFSRTSRPMRRASSGLPHSSPVRASSRASLHTPIEDPQHHTAASVASAYLERELAVHREQNSEADTVVILHDDCYGHRFSRPKTTKGTLSLIVERPERLHASVLGLSAAYIRLGGRHSGGRQPPHPEREIGRQLPFLVRKTARVVEVSSSYVTNVHGKAWMDELKTMCNSVSTNLASTGKELTRTPNGSSQSDTPPKQVLHEGDLYLSPESLNAFQGALGGVCEGIDAIFQNAQTGPGPSKAFVCIRPPGHHCSSDLPSGFCWLNNVHVGIEYAAQNYGLTHAVILDFDLHHGDGSQSITWARNSRIAKMPKNTTAAKKLAIGYYSLHDINSFPCEWGEDDKVQNASLCIENAHNQSVWNIHLEPWKTEADFWMLYEKKYSVLFEKALSFLRFHADRLHSSSGNILPKAAIFVSAGFDASQWEGQGMQRHKVNVPTDFFARFTEDTVKLAQKPGLGVDGRVISVLEGGYSDKALISGVMSHLSGLTRGKSRTESAPVESMDGLGIEMGRRMGALSLDDQDDHAKEQQPPVYSASWWNAENLSALEGLIAPPPPAPAPKKRTTASNTSHYTSPTQSFTAKVVDPTKIYRSTSGYSTLPTTSTESVVFPVPEVDWLTAVGELSKLLVPQNRQTKSCRPEELSEPRVKKERRSINALPSAEPIAPAGRMQLRERKTKAPNYAEPKSEDDSISGKAPSRADRRRTIADVSSLSEDKMQPAPPQLPAQQPNGQAKAGVAIIAKQEPSTNGVAASKPAKITLRTQQKAANTTNNGVAGKKKAIEKPAVPSRIKSKTGRTQVTSPSTNSIPKASEPTTIPSNDKANEPVQQSQASTVTDLDIDQITSSMENRLAIGAHASKIPEDATTRGASTNPLTSPTDQVRLQTEQQPMDTDPSGQSSHLALESGAVRLSQPLSSSHEPIAKDGYFSYPPAAAGFIAQPADTTVGSQPRVPSPSNSHFPTKHVGNLPTSLPVPALSFNLPAPDPSLPNQDVFGIPTLSHGIAPHQEPHRSTHAVELYKDLNSAEPSSGRVAERGLPIFSSEGHIPFGPQQTNQAIKGSANQQTPVSYSMKEEQTLGQQGTTGDFYTREAPAAFTASTGSALGSPAAPVNQEYPGKRNGLAEDYASTAQKPQISASNQPFADLPPVPDIWDVPDTPES